MIIFETSSHNTPKKIFNSREAKLISGSFVVRPSTFNWYHLVQIQGDIDDNLNGLDLLADLDDILRGLLLTIWQSDNGTIQYSSWIVQLAPGSDPTLSNWFTSLTLLWNRFFKDVLLVDNLTICWHCKGGVADNLLAFSRCCRHLAFWQPQETCPLFVTVFTWW